MPEHVAQSGGAEAEDEDDWVEHDSTFPCEGYPGSGLSYF